MRSEEKQDPLSLPISLTSVRRPADQKTPNQCKKEGVNKGKGGRLRAIELGVLVDEVVEGLQGTPHLGLADLKTVPRLVVVSDSDFTVGLLLFVGRPAPGNLPSFPGLLESRTCGGDVFEVA